jgi:hypothetical protein
MSQTHKNTEQTIIEITPDHQRILDSFSSSISKHPEWWLFEYNNRAILTTGGLVVNIFHGVRADPVRDIFHIEITYPKNGGNIGTKRPRKFHINEEEFNTLRNLMRDGHQANLKSDVDEIIYLMNGE